MKVLHVIPSLSASDGGPSFAMTMMERALRRAGLHITIATTTESGARSPSHAPHNRRTEGDGSTHFYFPRTTHFYKVSFPLLRWLKTEVTTFDVVHVHALFSFPSVSAARRAHRCRVPYVIRPLGVLNRYGMTRRRRSLKRLSFHFIERPLLGHAAAIHYTSEQERVEAEAAGATGPAVVLPLGIDTSRFAQLPPPDAFLSRFPQLVGRSVVLFLSRLDPKKGLDLLLPAFARALQTFPKAILVIAGDGDLKYAAELRALAARLRIEKDIVWTGFLNDAEKPAAMSATTIFVLPSYSENFGVALVEAMAAGLACITTEGVAVSESLQNAKAGLVVRPEVTGLAQALETLLESPAACTELGSKARHVAQERFSLDAMGAALCSLYERIARRS